MHGVLRGQRVVRDAGLTSESDVWQQNMAEKVRNRCPLTFTPPQGTVTQHEDLQSVAASAQEKEIESKVAVLTWCGALGLRW